MIGEDGPHREHTAGLGKDVYGAIFIHRQHREGPHIVSTGGWGIGGEKGDARVVLLGHDGVRGILVTGVGDDDGVAQHATGRHRVGEIGLGDDQHRPGVDGGGHGGRKRAIAPLAQPIGTELDQVGEQRAVRQWTGGADGDDDGVRPADRDTAERPVAGVSDSPCGRRRRDVSDVSVQEIADDDVRGRYVAGVGVENGVGEQVTRLHRVGAVVVGQVHPR